MHWITEPGSQIAGSAQMPGDKSISHRALMLNAISTGRARISGLLEGQDCLATLAALRALGVEIRRKGAGNYEVEGRGLGGLHAADEPLYLGNSGTAMRLMAGLLCGRPFRTVLTGDESLSRRPMARIIRPLSAMGASIRARGNRPPLRIEPVGELRPIRYGMPVASAQVKSAILLAALQARGETVVSEPAPCRDHTERLLSAMGVTLSADKGTVSVVGPATLTSLDIAVPGDLSSAAFFIVGATIAGAGPLTLPSIGINPTRIGLIDILREMGGDIEYRNRREIGGEPIADIVVTPAELRGIDVDPAQVPLAIDEFPVLFVAAAAARGSTQFRGIAELRHKESDRILAMVTGLRTLGIECTESDDGAVVTGGPLAGGRVDSCGDHRVAMAFAVAGTVASGPIRIADTANVATSFPRFAEVCQKLGLRLSAESSE